MEVWFAPTWIFQGECQVISMVIKGLNGSSKDVI